MRIRTHSLGTRNVRGAPGCDSRVSTHLSGFLFLLNGRQLSGDGGGRGAACWMAPAGCAYSEGKPWRGCDVVDDVVGPGGVRADPAGNMVELEGIARTPGDVVIRAGGVAADTDGSDEHALRIVKREAAAEDIDSTDAPADHGVLGGSVVVGVAAIGDGNVDGVAGLEAEQGASGLNGAVEVGGGEGELGQAEGVRGIGLLRGDYAAARPLTAAIGAGESYGADYSVAIDDGGPHIEVKAAIGCGARGGKGRLELGVRGEKFAYDFGVDVAAGRGLRACRNGHAECQDGDEKSAFGHFGHGDRTSLKFGSERCSALPSCLPKAPQN